MEQGIYYRNLYPYIKSHAFDVLTYYSEHRHSFDGMHFTAQFGKLFDECKAFMDIDDDALAKAVDIVLSLEQRRMNSYSQGNNHIEDYVPANVKSWTEYMK